MPSLLSRLFPSRRKSADAPHLLGGEKYEAVEQPSSPSAHATSFPQSSSKSPPPTRDSKPFTLRKKVPSSPSPPPPFAKAPQPPLPSLSLTLPDPNQDEKKSAGLAVVFEGIMNGPPLLSDDVLASRILSPSDALYLVQKTAESISQKGVETLGVMRPHWFASSRHQEIQQKLLSRYLQVLSAQQAAAPAPSSSTSTSPLAAFESELRYTSDQHDVAAVLRWALRHLQLDAGRLGATEDWYRSFAESEKAASYPPKAFDDIFTPLLPDTHAQLVRVLLDLVSSLAAHSEQNGISGNKLSKVLAWWLVSSRNTTHTEFSTFYQQWQVAARQFEHMFLAFIRAQEAHSRMPRRLTELVKNYPFTKNRREDDGVLLPRPSFSTRKTPALLLRVEVNKVADALHPLRIVEEAFNASANNNRTVEGDIDILWRNVCDAAFKSTEGGAKDPSDRLPLNLSLVLADESIRLLTLVPSSSGPASPTVSMFQSLPADKLRRSLSNSERPQSTISATAVSEKQPVAASPALSIGELDAVTDWHAFSSAGFKSPSGLSLAASLWDNDTEVTQPHGKKGTGTAKLNLSTRSGRTSTDAPAPLPIVASQASPSEAKPVRDAEPAKTVRSSPDLVQLDEAFIDFWADTLLDTVVTRTWPTFVVCQLKPVANFCLPERDNDRPIEWLIIERVLAKPDPSPSSKVAEPSSPVGTAKSSTSIGNKGFRWSLKKRWSHFGTSSKVASIDGDLEKPSKAAGVKVGEMGEVLKEEEEESKSEEKREVPPKVHTNGISHTEGKKLEADGVQHNGSGQHLNGKPEAKEPKSPDAAERRSLEVAAVAAAAGGPEVLAGIVELNEIVPPRAAMSPSEPVTHAQGVDTAAVATTKPVIQEPEVVAISTGAVEEHVKEISEPVSSSTVVEDAPVALAVADHTSLPVAAAAEEVRAATEITSEPEPSATAQASAVATEPTRDTVEADVVAAPIEPVVIPPQETDESPESKESEPAEPEPELAPVASEQVPAVQEPEVPVVPEPAVPEPEEPAVPEPEGPTVPEPEEPAVPEPEEPESEPGVVQEDVLESTTKAVPAVEERRETAITAPGLEALATEDTREPAMISEPEGQAVQVLDKPTTDVGNGLESEALTEHHVNQDPVTQVDAEFTTEPEATPEIDSAIEATPEGVQVSNPIASVEQSQDHEDAIAKADQSSSLEEERVRTEEVPSAKVATLDLQDVGEDTPNEEATESTMGLGAADSVESGNHYTPVSRTEDEKPGTLQSAGLASNELSEEPTVTEEQGVSS